MIKKLFGIENDGITVTKEQVKLIEYTKYPPKSKYVLYQNLKIIILMLIVLLIIIIKAGDLIFDSHLSIPFIGCIFICGLMVGTSIYDTIIEWKHGKYW